MPEDKKQTVLVLGGAGFIGSHLCDKLVKKHNVICVDNFISGFPANIEHLLALPNFVFINTDVNQLVDLEQYEDVEKFDIKFHGIQEIYNLSVPTSPKNFNKFKVETAVTNALGTINALNLAVKYRAKFLQFSSSVVYGVAEHKKEYIQEDSFSAMNPLDVNAVYDEGKRFAETLTLSYREKYDIDAKILRIFRVYGPRMPLFEGHMIPDFIVAALDNKELVLYGGEEFTTSLLYVDDVISAVEKIMKTTQAGPYNIGNPLSHNLSEVAKSIIKMTDSSSTIKYAEKLQFMRELGLPDITRAKKEIDWFPLYTLEKGLEKTIEYTQAHKILINWADIKEIKE